MRRHEELTGSDDHLSKDVESIVTNTEEIVSRFEGNPEQLKDFVYQEFVKQALVEDFFDGMAEYVDDEDLDIMQGAMASFSDDEIVSALSLPFELRKKWFEKFEHDLLEGVSPEEVMKAYVSTVAKYGFGIGFHTSPLDIRPEDGNDSWTIKGTEADHRDDDRMMAYYSTQYRHIYKKKHPKFIYVVRTDPSTHKTDGNWSRADSLSVIMRIPFETVVQYVESTVRNGKAPDA